MRLKQRRNVLLPQPRRADQRGDLVAADGDVDVLEGLERAVAEVEVLHLRLDGIRVVGRRCGSRTDRPAPPTLMRMSRGVRWQWFVAGSFGFGAAGSSSPARALLVLLVAVHASHAWLRSFLPLDASCAAGSAGQIATAFMLSVSTSSTMPAAAALWWNSGSGREIQLNIWIGSTVNCDLSHSKRT